MRPAIISVTSAVGFAIVGWAVPVVFPHVQSWIAKDMLWVAGALFALAGLLGLWGLRKPTTDGEKKQSTTGSGAHNFANVHGNVIFNSPIAAVQPTKSTNETAQPNIVDALIEAKCEHNRQAIHTRLSAFSDGLRDGLSGESAMSQPDMSLNEVLTRVAKAIGGNPEGGVNRSTFHQKLGREVMDQVVRRGMQVWGRQGDRGRQLIRREILSRAELNVKEGRLIAALGLSGAEYTDLKFDGAEVISAWPDRK